jgi:hypothetical protein
MQDVEDIYLTESFRIEMRNRFEWTIALDPRYQVIVYAMILEQLDESDGYRKRFSVSEIGEMVEAYWPEAFSGAGVGDLRPLLDELISLGVLVRTEDGLYRLRSANVVRALGSPGDIMSAVEDIISKPPPSDDKSSILRVERGKGPYEMGVYHSISGEGVGETSLRNCPCVWQQRPGHQWSKASAADISQAYNGRGA